ncbi:thiamine phosphate synthase [Thalassospira sp. SM2505]
MKSFDLSLYLVLDPDLCRTHSMVETTMAAIAGGATIVQLRDKKAGTEGLIRIGRELIEAMAGTGVPLIVNDDIEAAIAIGADGLHVGQDDLPSQTARERLGRDKIIGLSIEDETVARKVDPGIVDYVGIGPVFATSTKPDHKPAIGFDGLADLVKIAGLPSVAIGGLKKIMSNRSLAPGPMALRLYRPFAANPTPKAPPVPSPMRLRH